MVQKIEAYMSDDGQIHKSEWEALNADLRNKLAIASGNDPIGRMIAEHVSGNLSEFIELLNRMRAVDPNAPELPGLD